MINAGSPFWSLDSNQWALPNNQSASPFAPAEILGATRHGGPPRPGMVPPKGPLSSPKPSPWLAGVRRAGDYSFQSALRRRAEPGSARSQLGGLRALPGSGRWSRADGRERGRVPGTRPGACGLGGGAARIGSTLGSGPEIGPSGGGDRGRLRGSGCSRRAQPRAHLTGVWLRGRAGLGRTPERRGVLQPLPRGRRSYSPSRSRLHLARRLACPQPWLSPISAASCAGLPSRRESPANMSTSAGTWTPTRCGRSWASWAMVPSARFTR